MGEGKRDRKRKEVFSTDRWAAPYHAISPACQPPILPNPLWGALSAPLAHNGGSVSLSKNLRAGMHPLALNLTCTNWGCGQVLLRARLRTASLLLFQTLLNRHQHAQGWHHLVGAEPGSLSTQIH